jgi:1-acyl-sn-glycerol-3-phosphate acyltransferase
VEEQTKAIRSGLSLFFIVGATLLLLFAGSLVMLAAALLTGFRKGRFYREVLLKNLAGFILRIWSIDLAVEHNSPSTQGQVVYIFNHSSTLDLFVLAALGLPNTRFFLSRELWRIFPIGLMAWICGVFFTVPQDFPERRKLIFSKAATELQRTGESVYLSPEGERVVNGKVGPFNKGAFHLAASLHAPIVPLFIHIPKAMNPGLGWGVGSGIVRVHFMEPLSTESWRLEDLITNKDNVRAMYLNWCRQFEW